MGAESICLVLPLALGSSISNSRKSPFISPLLGKSSSKKKTYRDSIYITLPIISSAKNTYPLENSEYLMKIHFFPLGLSVKPDKNSIFLKNGKTVILVENRKFSRSMMTKRTASLNSSRKI